MDVDWHQGYLAEQNTAICRDTCSGPYFAAECSYIPLYFVMVVFAQTGVSASQTRVMGLLICLAGRRPKYFDIDFGGGIRFHRITA